jgi:hypothetical protein
MQHVSGKKGVATGWKSTITETYAGSRERRNDENLKELE